MFERIVTKLDAWQASGIVDRSPYRQHFRQLPTELYQHWCATASADFPGVRQDRVMFVRATEGLFMFFDCVRRSDRPCALPSKAADSVWHAWLSLAPMGLERFCERYFGRSIPHVEAAQMQAAHQGMGMQEALAACLVQARLLDKQDPASDTLPRLFTLDKRLKMADGFAYASVPGKVGYQFMDDQGRRYGSTRYNSALEPINLLALGLITDSAFDAYQRRALANAQGDGGASFSIGGDSGDCGGDAGSSCGSSCGGGCGGGCGS